MSCACIVFLDVHCKKKKSTCVKKNNVVDVIIYMVKFTGWMIHF